jgi:mannose-6-phosphate isomerase
MVMERVTATVRVCLALGLICEPVPMDNASPPGSDMFRLDNPVQHYAWGSRTAIPGLLGRSPTGAPWAELWMGAHARAPSIVVGDGRTLLEYIAADPGRALGREVAARSGGELPFLFKVLAAAEPLSLQAHPSLAQAEAGFAAEEAAGVPRDAPHRNYKDAHHKPELLCALEPFEALCGFRPVAETIALLQRLDVDALDDMLARLQAQPDANGLRVVFGELMRLPASQCATLVSAVVDAAQRVVEGPFAHECLWAVRLHAAYPGDAGVVGAMLLNLVHLAPGDAIFLPAGNLHAYLRGVGVELMASSDNVLRGGLTPKHVDVDALLDVLDFEPLAFAPLHPEDDGEEAVYRTPAPEFRLSRLQLSTPFEANAWGPEILLVIEGRCRAEDTHGSLALERGASAFVSPDRYRLVPEPEAVVFRAAVNDRSPC